MKLSEPSCVMIMESIVIRYRIRVFQLKTKNALLLPIALFFTFTCSTATAQSQRWDVQLVYREIFGNPEIIKSAYNNCVIWRQRNKYSGESFYKSSSGYYGMMAQKDYEISKALAVAAAIHLWTRKNCPDIW